MAAVGRLPKLAAMTPQNLRLQDFSTEPARTDSLLCADQIIDLLRKYDRAGPRYTSYPPATQFRATGSEDYLQALAESAPDAPVSVYIHIPFCRSPCYYCGCNKIITRNRDAVRQYLNHLRKEMALLRLQSTTYKRPVTQLHLGGGTPTFLDNAELTELVHHTSHYFNLVNADSRDYSIEIDPRTVDRARIELIRGLGFNRLSLGIQDFDPAVQGAINRQQRVEDIRELVGHIRTRGFSSLNFDLIYGLPLQTPDSIQMTLEKVIALSPDRISYYNYAHLPERFPAQKAIRNEDLPAPGLQTTFLNPWKAGGTTFVAFLAVGVIPLLPMLVPGLDPARQFLISSGLACVMFFAIGMLKSLVFARPVLKAGLQTLVTGGGGCRSGVCGWYRAAQRLRDRGALKGSAAQLPC